MEPEKTAGGGNDRLAMIVLTAMVFAGAILLFGLEPLAGRLLTPYFGGAAHVWLTCLMFFQAVLFIGYLYAHLFARKLGVWHLAILALPLVNLPLQVHAQPDPNAPLVHLLYVLSLYVALPFAVLSTTAVVAQAWLTHSRVGQNQEPYPLYAASNAGSLIALLGYTFVAEPLIGVKLQSVAWSLTYVLYAALVVASWFCCAQTWDRWQPRAGGDRRPSRRRSARRFTASGSCFPACPRHSCSP